MQIKILWLADMEILDNIQKKQWMKELLQQTVGNELIHCQKLLGKSKHIQKKKKLRLEPNLEILGSVSY